MKSIRTRITIIIVIAIVLSAGITLLLGINDVIELGQSSSEQALKLLCESGEKNLDYYFESVSQSVDMVGAYAEADLEAAGENDLQAHMDRVNNFFGTHMIGPVLILNPFFTKYLIGKLMDTEPENITVAYEKEAMEAYEKRVELFNATRFIDIAE